MRYTTVKSIAQITGTAWMPQCFIATQKELSGYDLENMKAEDGSWTRNSVEHWILCHSGDFSSISDFRVEIEDGSETHLFDWQNEDSEYEFSDAMYGDRE